MIRYVTQGGGGGGGQNENVTFRHIGGREVKNNRY